MGVRPIVWLMLLMVLSMAAGSRAQPATQADTRPAASRLSRGTLVEITDDYLLLQSPGEAPCRYWFTKTPAGSEAALRSAVATLHVGNQVEVRWSDGGLKHVEQVQAVAAAPVQAPPAESRPAASNAPVMSLPPAPITVGERINAWIDNLLATGVRLLELPLFMLLLAAGGVALGLAGLIYRLGRRGRHPLLIRGLYGLLASLALLTVAFLMDRKIASLQQQVNALRTRSNADAVALLDTVSQRPTGLHHRQSFLFDPVAAQQSLAASFGQLALRPLLYDEATDIVQVHINNPLAQVYLAVIDLNCPGVEIKLGATLDKKRLTSVFARENDCTVAINGEAGMSPEPGSGLGVWRGNLVREGQWLLREDAAILRPFLSFDRQNHARFTAAGAAGRSVASDAYNVIWGRLDALVDGTVQTADARNRQPRTAMAISQDGSRLYLMVVDGRQPRYSMGFTRAEVGAFLKAFGAFNGMLCDEGGSSCMYLKQFGGICNVPSDNQGQERPTYTHFGIFLRSVSTSAATSPATHP